jgi:hypothetical protein
VIRYLKEQADWFGMHWNRFWFTPSYGEQLVRVRLPICFLAAIWFAIMFSNTTWWFGDAGWAESELSRSLSTATEGPWAGRFRFSPLWATSKPIVFQIWATVGLLLAIVAAVGVGGRIALLALFLSVLCLAQRLTWATGAFEPALVAALGYLLVDPGRSLLAPAAAQQHSRWSATLATGLLQVHTWMLIVAALASQLASATWWRGEAVWWLTATGHSTLLTTDLLRGRILIVNAATHGITVCTLIAVAALWPLRMRPIALVCGCVLGAAYALVSDQILYGSLLVALLIGAFTDGRGSK